MSISNARELNVANSLKQDQNFWWEVANLQHLFSVNQKTLKNASQSVQAEDAQENVVANSLNWTTKSKNSLAKLLDHKLVNLSNIIVVKMCLMEDANQKFVALTKRMEKSSKNFLANKMVKKFVNQEPLQNVSILQPTKIAQEENVAKFSNKETVQENCFVIGFNLKIAKPLSRRNVSAQKQNQIVIKENAVNFHTMDQRRELETVILLEKKFAILKLKWTVHKRRKVHAAFTNVANSTKITRVSNIKSNAPSNLKNVPSADVLTKSTNVVVHKNVVAILWMIMEKLNF
jgi:hypothetical protein